MLFQNKKYFCLAIVFSFASICYASTENALQEAVEKKSSVQIAREYIKQGKCDEAIEILKYSANQGIAEAQCLLGVIYLEEKNNSSSGAKIKRSCKIEFSFMCLGRSKNVRIQ